MRSVDLNADMGEGFGEYRVGDDAGMLDIVTSANVACGAHAGDPEIMARTFGLARERGVAVGSPTRSAPPSRSPPTPGTPSPT